MPQVSKRPSVSHLSPFRQKLWRERTSVSALTLESLAKRSSNCPARLARRRNIRELLPNYLVHRPFRPSSSGVSSLSERQSVLAFHASPPLTKHSGGSDGAFLWATLESFAKTAAQTAQRDSFRHLLRPPPTLHPVQATERPSVFSLRSFRRHSGASERRNAARTSQHDPPGRRKYQERVTERPSVSHLAPSDGSFRRERRSVFAFTPRILLAPPTPFIYKHLIC